MARRRDQNRVPKTLVGKLRDLDDQLYLLRSHLHRLREDPSHLKAISGGLRTLVCLASGTEGLLWRLVDELGVSDAVHLHLVGSVDTSHPLMRGLGFYIVPIARAGYGFPKITPAFYSLRSVIKNAEAVYVGKSSLTHESLIRALSEQMGLAHEDDGISLELAQLSQILLGGVEPYYGILATDAELTLEVGERVLEVAEQRGLYQRAQRASPQGDLTLLLRFKLKRSIEEPMELFSTRSWIGGFRLIGSVRPGYFVYSAIKREHLVKELVVPTPQALMPGTQEVFAWSYSSNARKARAITGHIGATEAVDCDLGWLDVREVIRPDIPDGVRDRVDFDWILSGRNSPPAMLQLTGTAGFAPARPGTPGTPPTGR